MPDSCGSEPGKNYLLENADDATADLLENVRLGRMSLKGPEGTEQ